MPLAPPTDAPPTDALPTDALPTDALLADAGLSSRRPSCARPLLARVLLITDGVTVPTARLPMPTPTPQPPHLTALSSATATDPARLFSQLTAVLAAVPPGSVAVQLRNRELAPAALYPLAIALRQLTARFFAPFFVNDRLDLALSVKADGVHLPGHGLPTQTARRLVGADLLLCAAAHSVKEALALTLAGADAVTLSPIWPTPSKPVLATENGGVQPLGLVPLAQAVAVISRRYGVPVLALGGIDAVERVQKCAALGAGVACLRALLVGDKSEVSARAAAFVAAAHRAPTSSGG